MYEIGVLHANYWGEGVHGMADARPITNLVWQCHTNKLIT